jgi:hypothetical protein
MSGLPIETDAVNADPERFRWLFGLAPYPYPPARLITDAQDSPAAEAEAPAAPEAPEAESGTEDEAPDAEMAGEGTEPPAGEGTTCLIPPADSPLAPPYRYGHQSLTDALAAKDEPAEAEATPDAEAGQ